MEGYKNCTLSELLIVLHKHFFPNAHKKYIQLNVQNCEAYRKYKKEVPDFLRNRPRDFVRHMMTRLDTTLDNSHIKILDRKSGIFEVNSEENAAKTYQVTFKDGIPSCTCADWENHFLPCKHICCILKYNSQLKWDRLNPAYCQNPLFLLDKDCLSVSSVEPKIESDYMATPLSDSNVLALPDRKKSRRKKLIHNCVLNLKRIIDCTYLQKNEKYLEELDENIKLLLQNIQANIPFEKDLPLIETPKKKINK
ncbi:uncharacterized protein LOC121394263 [Xenopus laevis]|uniref:Uncharacterized protein LOC121394263 n=1 Tax=Xenopus laevis TaxID=8355 RepID=A0A8J1KVA7_XENLA|nr:uncharacterized protein LOC121394263 [Xenopus laevis]